MKRKYILAAAVFLILFTAMLTGCASAEERAAASLIENTAPEQLYTQAISKITDTQNFALSVTSDKLITTERQTLYENAQQSMHYRNYGSGSASVSVEQAYTYGENTISSVQEYVNGRAYTKLEDSAFSCNISFEDYIQRLFPVSFLDPSIYETAETKQIGSRILIGFSDPIKAEGWALPSGAVFTSASASVVLDSTGQFIEGTYTITYGDGTNTVQESFTVIPAQYDAAHTFVWDDAVPIRNIFAPLTLERICGFLTSANKVSAQSVDTITSQLGGLDRTQTTSLTLEEVEEDIRANIDITVALADKSRPNEESVHHQMETFQNGVYTICVDDETSREEAVTSEDMDRYCRNILVANIPMLEHVENVVVLQSGQDVCLTFELTEEYAQLICAAACDTLYQDPELLDTLSSSYKTNTMECSIYLDAVTGLPTASSFVYKGTHTIDGQVYTLISEAKQDYSFS